MEPTIQAMNLQNVPIPRPDLPAEWNYDESVTKVKSFAYRWNKLQEDSPEILQELWIARDKLKIPPQISGGLKGVNVSSDLHTWSNYCQDIGSSKQVVNRWLQAFKEGGRR